MKRKWAKKVKANPACKVKRQARTAAMIGLIISTGASHLILTRLGDSAPANQPPVQEPIGNVSAKTEAGLAGSNINLVEPKTDKQVSVAAFSTNLTPTPPTQQQETVETALPAIEHTEQTRQKPNQQAQLLRVATRSKLTLPQPQKSLSSTVAVLEQNLPRQTEPQNKKLLQVLRVNRLIRQLKHSQTVATNSRFEAVNRRYIASSAVVASSQIGTEKSLPAIREDKSTWSAKQKLLISRLKQKENRLQDSLAKWRFEESKSSVAVIEKTEPISNHQKEETQSKTVASLGLLPGGTPETSEQINSQQSPQPATVFVIPAITPANNGANVVVSPVVSEYRRGALKAALLHGLPLAASLKANHLDNPNRQQITIPASTGNTVGQNIGWLKNPKQQESIAVAPSVNVSYRAMGGDISDDDSVEATPPANVEQIQQAQSAAAQALLSNQPVQNLETDIQKLRQKYHQGVLITQALPSRDGTNTTPITAARTEEKLLLKIRSQTPTSQPINPEFSANQAAKSLQLDGQKQQDIRVRSTQTVIKNGVATAPLGTDAASLRSFQEQNVSPALPPLGGVDNYLPKPTSISAQGLIWPARGKLTSGYGWRWGRMHKGVDIAAPIGTPVMAAAPGVVVKAGWNNGGYGNMIDIQHPDGTLTRYAHNKRLLVHTGEAVQQGQQISEMGSTGFSTGPHLHFEVHPMGKKAVNPIAYLPR